jgi:signal transduction histidine kinase
MSIWSLFPYPTLLRDASSGQKSTLESGSIVKIPQDCLRCPTRECQDDDQAERSKFRECRYGLNYVRVDDNRLIVGIVASGQPGATKQNRRRARRQPELRVDPRLVLQAISAACALGPGAITDFEQSKQETLEELRNDPRMFEALAQQLKDDFQEALSQSHDFLQLVKLVRGYAEVLLQEKLPGIDNLDAAEQLPVEGAIYFSTELMLLKMNALTYLHEINLAHGQERTFRIHPLVLKYRRIYAWQANQKQLDLQLVGECYNSYRYNPEAIGVVLQGLLDNLVKYAPSGSRATINFQEDSSQVTISFTSLGPRINDDEVQQIFLPGYRGRAAQYLGSSGLGIGLATAKQVSDALDLDLTVDQDPREDSKYRDRFSTTFAITLSQ